MDSDEESLPKVYWRDYTIASRKLLWPEVVHDYKDLAPDEGVAKLLRGDAFDNISADDVNDLIDAHSQPLTDEDLTEMTKLASEKEEQEELVAEE
ncbi:unnamed protein product [Soboliphyme baturini]|uniref:Integrase n=1 Tax=Soboliphyme baturini TaxID=241478 RepID=A0A183I979_9BILA|nr:unnamed protein product [Soboliphyme baturini]